MQTKIKKLFDDNLVFSNTRIINISRINENGKLKEFSKHLIDKFSLIDYKNLLVFNHAEFLIASGLRQASLSFFNDEKRISYYVDDKIHGYHFSKNDHLLLISLFINKHSHSQINNFYRNFGNKIDHLILFNTNTWSERKYKKETNKKNYFLFDIEEFNVNDDFLISLNEYKFDL